MIDPETTLAYPSCFALRELAAQCADMALEAEDMAQEASGERRATYLRLAALWSALAAEIRVSASIQNRHAMDN